jgi:hypothetical protein
LVDGAPRSVSTSYSPRLINRTGLPIEGFGYSEANKASGVVWDEKVFAKYIADPKSAMPGNKMAFVGIKDEKDVADLIAYLKMFDADGKQSKYAGPFSRHNANVGSPCRRCSTPLRACADRLQSELEQDSAMILAPTFTLTGLLLIVSAPPRVCRS